MKLKILLFRLRHWREIRRLTRVMDKDPSVFDATSLAAKEALAADTEEEFWVAFERMANEMRRML